MSSKILILTNNSGGLYRFRKELMHELLLMDYNVIASTPFDENIDDLKKLGITLVESKINRRGMNPIKDLGLILTYFKIINKIKPDLIITYTIKPNLYGGTVASFFRIPFAINITGLGTAFQNDNFLKKIVIKWYYFICKRVKTVFFENEGNKNVFVNNDIVLEEKCCVLNGAGVNLEDFYFVKYPKVKDKIHFLFIGRIMKEKGVEELFWAIEKLHQKYLNVQLDILGNFEDNYKDIIESLSNKKIIKYYGYQNDVRSFIKNCHCFVLPSYHEGMANTLLECASMGRPLITSDIPGCREAVHDSGYLCKVRDRDDLYEKMRKFIEADYEERKEMGINSRRHMEEVFDKRKVVEKTVKELKI